MDGEGDIVEIRINGCGLTAIHPNRQFFFDQGLVQAAGLIGNSTAAKHVQAGWAGEQAVEH